MSKTISREQLRQQLEAKVKMTIVEALPEKYFKAGHIPNAINIPHDEISQNTTHLLPDKDELIVVYCANSACKNSKIASQTLAGLGYQNVVEYVEGKEDWKAAKLPLEN